MGTQDSSWTKWLPLECGGIKELYHLMSVFSVSASSLKENSKTTTTKIWHPVGKPNRVNLQSALWDPELIAPSPFTCEKSAGDIAHSPPISSYSVPSPETFALHLCKHQTFGGKGGTQVCRIPNSFYGGKHGSLCTCFFAPRENAQIWLERLKIISVYISVKCVIHSVFQRRSVCFTNK